MPSSICLYTMLAFVVILRWSWLTDSIYLRYEHSLPRHSPTTGIFRRSTHDMCAVCSRNIGTLGLRPSSAISMLPSHAVRESHGARNIFFIVPMARFRFIEEGSRFVCDDAVSVVQKDEKPRRALTRDQRPRIFLFIPACEWAGRSPHLIRLGSCRW